MDLEFINNRTSKFDIKTVKKIFLDIENTIKNSVLALHNTVEKDNQKYLERYEIAKFLDVIERTKEEEWILSKNSSEVVYNGIGNIGVCYNGSPYIFLYLCLKALKTHNNIIFIEDDNIHQTTALLQEIIENACKKNNYNMNIKTTQYNQIANFIVDTNNIDTFIFINEQQKYLDYCARQQNDIKVIYSNYGTMDLFLADKQLKDRLIEMDEYVYENNIDLEIYKNDTVENIVKKINTRKNNYCAVIFTTNTKEAYYFLENVKAEKIFINRNPKSEYEFYLSDEKLTLKKEIYI